MSLTQFVFSSIFKNKYFIPLAMMVAAVTIGASGLLNPVILLGMVVVFYFFLLLLRWPDFTVLMVIFVVYTNSAVVLTRFHGVPSSVGYALPMLLLIPFVWQITVNRRKLKVNPVFFLMLIYFSIILLGSAFSKDITLALPSLINFMMEGLCLYFLTINTIRTPKLMNQVVWSLIIAGAFMGGISLFQQVTGSFDNAYGGYAQVDGRGFTVGETLQGIVYQPRAAGPIGEKNYYAQVMLMLVPLGLFRSWGESSNKLRLLAYILTGLIFIGASLTFSRGAQVAMLILIFIMVLMRYIKVRELAVILLGLALLVTAFPQNAERFLSLAAVFSSQDQGGLRSADESIQGRATEMTAALLVFLDHPIVGVGPGMFSYEMADYSKSIGLKNIITTREAHSLYPGIAAESGLLGFFTIMGIFMYTLYRLAKARSYWLARKQISLSNLCTGFFLAIISYMATGLFLHMAYVRFLWVMIALAVITSEFREADLTDSVKAPDAKAIPSFVGGIT